MIFSKEDFKVESLEDLIEFAPILIFVGLVAPFVLAAYKVGFIMDQLGWLKTDS